ncbi:MAG: hypothetical protein PWQ51_2583 [Methanolobus sp.]|jgi:hypothetical protein|uniref:Uncharacterized protein n=1 Tax=Methanolobus tindarius DSM 2278 TaxID=1090322 RepID=W9DME6_METTI|nr:MULTISPECIES: hypothetical protein [Methanolobus]ETA66674.1 hypothetical protein MettiDRAFT_0073 [Methanolobus tindarius DSM 2278]MDI3485934.1 hypothetical protein [Methanolobus sp.]MDK2832627.1 hypothetical protein [Methanolobus sp.]MDK2940418.1 hypothetical protein [Methanolobus sp.]
MKTERKILVCENGKLVLRNISLAYTDSNGETAYLFEPEKKAENQTESYYDRIENNFLLIGLLRKVDMSKLSNEEVQDLMLRKHEKEETFLRAGRANGYNLGLDMNPDDILRFYISLSPEERVALECKP